MQGYGAFENQAGAMVHRPPIFKNTWAMLTELAEEGVLPKRYSRAVPRHGLAAQHVHLLRCAPCAQACRARASRRGRAARLLDYQDHPELDAVDKLVVEYAIAVTNNWNRTRDEIFVRLKEHFSEAQIVEMTWRTALCGAFNRFNDILQLDIEHGVAAREAAE